MAPRSHHARPAARVLVADAPDAAHASGDVPAVRARPDLLGRRAPGPRVPRPPEPHRPRGLGPPAGRGTARRASPTGARRPVRHGRRVATRGVTRPRRLADPTKVLDRPLESRPVDAHVPTILDTRA